MQLKASEIDPLALPYVRMSELIYLPTCSGVYFVIRESGEVIYIGRSVNIRQRWRAHNAQKELCNIRDLESARHTRVAWLQAEKSEIAQLEIRFIRQFKPRLNVNHVPVEPKQRTCPSIKRITLCDIAGVKKTMITAAEFAEAIGVPYPTVALWLREGRIAEAEQLELGGLRVWQMPATAVKLYKGEQKRPKRGRPQS